MKDQGLSFEAYALSLSEAHADYWKKHALSERKRSVLAEEAESSWRQQRKVEQSDLLDFDTYLQRYMEKR
jgi:glutamate--cysteine ligase